MEIKPFELEDIEEVKKFTDKWIGKDYYSLDGLKAVHRRSLTNGLNCSLVARNSTHSIVGVRLSFAPGTWMNGFKRISPEKWNIPSESVAYFKSLFIEEKSQGKGLGKRLSEQSIEILKEMGAKGVLCHSWLESPNNSSVRYLENMGFFQISKHLKFWFEIDYMCTRCQPNRCVCTAAEMLKVVS